MSTQPLEQAAPAAGGRLRRRGALLAALELMLCLLGRRRLPRCALQALPCRKAGQEGGCSKGVGALQRHLSLAARQAAAKGQRQLRRLCSGMGMGKQYWIRMNDCITGRQHKRQHTKRQAVQQAPRGQRRCKAPNQAYLGELEDAPHFPDELGLALRAGLNQDAVGLVVVDHSLR